MHIKTFIKQYNRDIITRTKLDQMISLENMASDTTTYQVQYLSTGYALLKVNGELVHA